MSEQKPCGCGEPQQPMAAAQAPQPKPKIIPLPANKRLGKKWATLPRALPDGTIPSIAIKVEGASHDNPNA